MGNLVSFSDFSSKQSMKFNGLMNDVGMLRRNRQIGQMGLTLLQNPHANSEEATVMEKIVEVIEQREVFGDKFLK